MNRLVLLLEVQAVVQKSPVPGTRYCQTATLKRFNSMDSFIRVLVCISEISKTPAKVCGHNRVLLLVFIVIFVLLNDVACKKMQVLKTRRRDDEKE